MNFAKSFKVYEEFCTNSLPLMIFDKLVWNYAEFCANKQVYFSNNCSEDGTRWRAALTIFSQLASSGESSRQSSLPKQHQEKRCTKTSGLVTNSAEFSLCRICSFFVKFFDWLDEICPFMHENLGTGYKFRRVFPLQDLFIFVRVFVSRSRNTHNWTLYDIDESDGCRAVKCPWSLKGSPCSPTPSDGQSHELIAWKSVRQERRCVLHGGVGEWEHCGWGHGVFCFPSHLSQPPRKGVIGLQARSVLRRLRKSELEQVRMPQPLATPGRWRVFEYYEDRVDSLRWWLTEARSYNSIRYANGRMGGSDSLRAIVDEIFSGFRDKFQKRVTWVASSIKFEKAN